MWRSGIKFFISCNISWFPFLHIMQYFMLCLHLLSNICSGPYVWYSASSFVNFPFSAILWALKCASYTVTNLFAKWLGYPGRSQSRNSQHDSRIFCHSDDVLTPRLPVFTNFFGSQLSVSQVFKVDFYRLMFIQTCWKVHEIESSVSRPSEKHKILSPVQNSHKDMSP